MSGIFWAKSELFLTKIRTLIFNCRPVVDNSFPQTHFLFARLLDGRTKFFRKWSLLYNHSTIFPNS
jgi:hypothetical protein